MNTSEEDALALLSLRGSAHVSVPPDSSHPPLARIVNRTGTDTTYIIRKNKIVIGRESGHFTSDISLGHNSFISRAHLVLERRPDHVWTAVCNGKNGIFVNQDIVPRGVPPRPLPPECNLRFPSTNVMLEFSSLPEESVSAAQTSQSNPPVNHVQTGLVLPKEPTEPRGAKLVGCQGDVLASGGLNSRADNQRLLISVSTCGSELRSWTSSPTGTASATNSCPTSPKGSTSFDASSSLTLFDDSDWADLTPGPETETSTGRLSDTPVDETEKPPYSYAQLIVQAISSSVEKKLTLSGIYAYITKNYRRPEETLQNSIRHNLSLNRYFVKLPRCPDEPGKGCFWQLDPASEAKLVHLSFRKRRQRTNTGRSGSNKSAEQQPSPKPVVANGSGSSLSNDNDSGLSIDTSPPERKEQGSSPASKVDRVPSDQNQSQEKATVSPPLATSAESSSRDVTSAESALISVSTQCQPAASVPQSSSQSPYQQEEIKIRPQLNPVVSTQADPTVVSLVTLPSGLFAGTLLLNGHTAQSTFLAPAGLPTQGFTMADIAQLASQPVWTSPFAFSTTAPRIIRPQPQYPTLSCVTGGAGNLSGLMEKLSPTAGRQLTSEMLPVAARQATLPLVPGPCPPNNPAPRPAGGQMRCPIQPMLGGGLSTLHPGGWRTTTSASACASPRGMMSPTRRQGVTSPLATAKRTVSAAVEILQNEGDLNSRRARLERRRVFTFSPIQGAGVDLVSQSAPCSPKGGWTDSGEVIAPDRIHRYSGGTFNVRRNAKDGRQRLQLCHSPPAIVSVRTPETSALRAIRDESRSRHNSGSAPRRPPPGISKSLSATPVKELLSRHDDKTNGHAKLTAGHDETSRNGSGGIGRSVQDVQQGALSKKSAIKLCPSAGDAVMGSGVGFRVMDLSPDSPVVVPADSGSSSSRDSMRDKQQNRQLLMASTEACVLRKDANAVMRSDGAAANDAGNTCSQTASTSLNLYDGAAEHSKKLAHMEASNFGLLRLGVKHGLAESNMDRITLGPSPTKAAKLD